mgnify:FL=1
MRLNPLALRTVAAALGLSLALATTAMPALAQAEDPAALGTQLVEEFLDILKQPEAEKQALLADFLADEFQIVRSNGVVLDKGGYVERPATVNEVELSDALATRSGDVLVISYTLSVDEVLDGVETVTVAPRLSVFHLGDDGEWQIAAHANFGALENPEPTGG